MTRSTDDLMGPPPGVPAVDFTAPRGEPALAPAGGVSWRVFANPVALFIGGVTAVILELAEPRVRSGIWDHTNFRTDPLGRMRRTGYAAMVTVYGPKSAAEKMIAGISRMHARVSGVTPAGAPYRADDPDLLDWVQATASFGFLNAYHRYVRPLSQAERDAFYAEGKAAAALYGAPRPPNSEASWDATLARYLPLLERHDIVFEFLDIMRKTKIAPGPLRPLQGLFVRAAIELTPQPVRDILGLDKTFDLPFGAETLIKTLAVIAERAPIKDSPQAQASTRMSVALRN